MHYIENSEQVCGYKVKIWPRDRFRVTGYTLIVPPGKRGEPMVPAFWSEVIADGRMQKLKQTSSVPTWALGLSSWDEDCAKGGFRYTLCIEETEHTDFSRLAAEYDLHTQCIGASDWMCFESTHQVYMQRFWKDNPYKMMGPLGYQFHTRENDYSIGLHFDAYPPEFDAETNPGMEFWITVKSA